MKELWEIIIEAIKTLITKLLSFKNLVFGVATYVGVKVLYRLVVISPERTDVVHLFIVWAIYQSVLLVLFYASNQLQKWIFSRLANEVEEHIGISDEPERQEPESGE